MNRLFPLDRILLLVLGPLYLFGLGSHIVREVRVGIAEPFLYVRAGEPDGYPTVQSLRSIGNAASSGLRSGDELLRIGHEDLRGVGPLGFFARAQAVMSPSARAEIEFLRNDERQVAWLDYTRIPLPIKFALVSLSFFLTGLLLLFRAPRSHSARLLFRAMLLFSFGFLRPWTVVAELNEAWFLFGMLLGVPMFPVILMAVQAFPDELEASYAGPGWWPWIFAPLGPIFGSGILGVPLFGASGNLIYLIADALLFAFGIALLVCLTLNFRRCDPIGRRRIKWVVYGLYVSLTPVLIATAVSLGHAELWWLSGASEILEVLIPIFIFIAIVRFNLFDINRLISATASYSLLGIVFFACALSVIPLLASAASRATSLDTTSAQIALSTILAATLVLLQQQFRPALERIFFPERFALDRGMESLLEELPQCLGPEDLLKRAGERLATLLLPASCTIYVMSDNCFKPIFASGRAIPPAFSSDSALIAVLRSRETPLAMSKWLQASGRTPLGAFDEAALATVDAAVLLPIRREKSLFGFLCLGPKRSGDVYTSADLALLRAIGDRIAIGLARWDDAELIRQTQRMQALLQRYVPAAVTQSIEHGVNLEPGELPVSILFVDIRGYSGFAEDRGLREVFSTINQHTLAVSAIVTRCGGVVVEFNGDGMMAVFGAPRPNIDKERAAVRAGREIVSIVDAPGGGVLSVGVGIATGVAFVGSIESADRLLWTALGDTTNLAARLQGLSRELGAAMVVDLATWRGAGDAASEFTSKEQVLIRGRRRREDLYFLPLERVLREVARAHQVSTALD